MDHVVTTSSNGEDDRTGWLLHGPVDLIGSHAIGLVTMPWDSGEELIMPWLYPCICCQVDIFQWIGLQQTNEATMVSSVTGLHCVDMTIEQVMRFKVEYTRAIAIKEIQHSSCALQACMADNVQPLRSGVEKAVGSPSHNSATSM